MKLRVRVVTGVAFAAGMIGATEPARAGGLLLPGSGAISTSRAGAAVASAEGGEALALNPAGIAKSKGTTITVSAAIIDQALEFTRRGTYDDIADEALPYEGMAFPTVRNDAKPSLGVGGFQPIPVVAVTSDLGGVVPNLKVAAGLYAPTAYPFRDMCTELPGRGCQKYVFNGDPNVPPTPSRYDVVKQDALILLPSIAAAYSITDSLDVGARFSAGNAHIKSTVTLWGELDNYSENVTRDALFSVDAKDNFVTSFGLGVNYRVTPAIELAASYNSAINVNAKGAARTELGSHASFNGFPIVIAPPEDAYARCQPGGTRTEMRGCVELSLPQTATLGGRYRFLDGAGRERGDIELNVGWENWSAERASDYRVVVDGVVYLIDGNGDEGYAADIQTAFIRHNLKDTYNARLGGSYRIPVGASEVVVRGGIGYDTRAAKEGWYRVDLDGAARTTLALGAGYKARSWEVNVGGGMILEGSYENAGTCNPSGINNSRGCGPNGEELPQDERTGPDPVTPVLLPDRQAESPIAQGSYKSHYLMFMLGFSTWF
jgi:long-subunit fatty acid transport protein